MTLNGGEDDVLKLSAMIASLKNDFSTLAALIKTLGPPVSCGKGQITIRAHYLPLRNGKPMTGELLDEIRNYICNFALSRTEIEKVHQAAELATRQQRMMAYNKLRDEAADLFMKAQKSTNRNGECGELLLYLLVEWILEAPQLLAKMSLKTSASMPIHGSDGIHVKYDASSDCLVFLWGEAKLHATISGALDSAVTSISSTLKYDKLKEDINLIRRNINLSGLSATAQKRVIEYLDPLSPSYAKKIDASACLIGFDFDGFKAIANTPPTDLEQTFTTLLKAELGSAINALETRLAAAGVTHHRMEVFFLPLDSVDQLRKDWQNRIGWKA